MSELYYDECDAGITGGCGACKKCDPEWWAKKAFLEGMDKLEKLFIDIQEAESNLALVGFAPEAPISTATWRLFEFAVSLISDRCDINKDALSWFIYDNKWGRNERECSVDGNDPVKITNAEEFWEFEKADNITE